MSVSADDAQVRELVGRQATTTRRRPAAIRHLRARLATGDYSRNGMSDGCADESGSSERNRKKREKGETTKTEILVEADVIRGTKTGARTKT